MVGEVENTYKKTLLSIWIKHTTHPNIRRAHTASNEYLTCYHFVAIEMFCFSFLFLVIFFIFCLKSNHETERVKEKCDLYLSVECKCFVLCVRMILKIKKILWWISLEMPFLLRRLLFVYLLIFFLLSATVLCFIELKELRIVYFISQ